MKKIDFGFNDDEKLNSQWSGIEFYNGEYLDVVAYDNSDYLITRIVDSYRGLNGNIDVREIAQDYYSDGSYVTYANKEKNGICIRLQNLLNNPKMKDRLSRGDMVYDVLREQGIPVYMSHLSDVPSKSNIVPGIVTSVSSQNFNKLKESKRIGMGISMYHQAEEIKRLRQEIERLKNENLDRQTGRHM